MSDWLKVRSIAIRAVMRVLEDRGFTLPEPIYRIRIDSAAGQADSAMGVAMAEGKISEGDQVKAPRLSALADPAVDVGMDQEIARLAQEQRSVAEGDANLLDPARPME